VCQLKKRLGLEICTRFGDAVWVKPPGNRCDTCFTRGTMRKVTSDVVDEVDGMPRHARDLRYRWETFTDDDDLMVNVNLPTSLLDDNSDSAPSVEEACMSFLTRRNLHVKCPPDRYSP